MTAHKVMLKDVLRGANEAAETVRVGLSLCLEPPLLDGCVSPQPSVVNVDQRSVILCGCIFLMRPQLSQSVVGVQKKRLHPKDELSDFQSSATFHEPKAGLKSSRKYKQSQICECWTRILSAQDITHEPTDIIELSLHLFGIDRYDGVVVHLQQPDTAGCCETVRSPRRDKNPGLDAALQSLDYCCHPSLILILLQLIIKFEPSVAILRKADNAVY